MADPAESPGVGTLRLREASAPVVERAGALQGHLGLSGDTRWSTVHEVSDAEIEKMRLRISRGINAEAMATG